MSNSFKELESLCKDCQKCDLYSTRTNVVFGVGNNTSDIMFIGEAPGQQEDLKGEPFVGRAGQLLDKYLAAINLDRTKIFITNIVKCRPPNNRDPLPEEQKNCIDWLFSQISLINPKIIICVGRISAMQIIKPDFKVTKEHGIFFEKDNILYMGVYHPAALLRNPNLKPDTLEDFLKIEEKLKELNK